MSRGVEPTCGTEVLYNKLRMYSQCHHNLETTLVKHFEQNCIEVIVYDPFINKEANRLYVSARKVIYAAEFEYRESQRNVNVDTRKILNNLACDYILKRVHFVQRKSNECVIFLSSDVCVPVRGAKSDLTMFPSFQFLEKPEGLVAYTVKRSMRSSTISTELKLNINISTFSGDDVFTTPSGFPTGSQSVSSPRRFKMSPNSAFLVLNKSPESVVEVCSDSQRFTHRIPVTGPAASSAAPVKPVAQYAGVPPSVDPREPRPQQQQEPAVGKLSARRRSFAAVRDFTSRMMAPLFSGNNANSTTAAVAPAPTAPLVAAPATVESSSGKTRRLSLNIFQGGLPLFRTDKKKPLPPIEASLSEKQKKFAVSLDKKQHNKKEAVEQLEKTVQGSCYVPNPVAGDAPEGVFRPTPHPAVVSPPLSLSDLSLLSPQEQRKQKLYHRAVINKLQDKTAASAAAAVM